MKAVHFVVLGQAEPKGSTRSFVPRGWTRPITTSANPNLKGWSDHVKTEAQRVREAEQLFIDQAPVRLCLVFLLRRPQKLQTHRWRLLTLWHTTKPDLDKLARAVKDALTGVLFRDDSQVAQLVCEKLYVDGGEGPQCHVTVEALAPVRDLHL